MINLDSFVFNRARYSASLLSVSCLTSIKPVFPQSSAASVDPAHFARLLSTSLVFHPGRAPADLATHWQYMKQYSLLPDQTVQPLPRPHTAQHILNFHDGEDQVKYDESSIVYN